MTVEPCPCCLDTGFHRDRRTGSVRVAAECNHFAPSRFRFALRAAILLLVMNFVLPAAIAYTLWLVPRLGGWRSWR